MPPFTHEVQTWIWERQNPPAQQCADHQYLLGFVGTDQVLLLCMRSFSRGQSLSPGLTAATVLSVSLTSTPSLLAQTTA